MLMKLYVFTKISTHSLTRRLTRKQKLRRCYSLDFNSQPHKEADQEYLLFQNPILYFNSQPHKEADQRGFDNSAVISISTHSLTRRLTGYGTASGLSGIFQLTASQGG